MYVVWNTTGSRYFYKFIYIAAITLHCMSIWSIIYLLLSIIIVYDDVEIIKKQKPNTFFIKNLI